MNLPAQKQVMVVATSNPGKLKEFINILGEDFYEFKSLADVNFTAEIIENATTFNGNAQIKALVVGEWVFAHYPQYAVLADDSGLEVAALEGAPGVFTARYAGVGASDEQNYRKLLADLEKHPNRQARFVCSLCLWQNEHEPLFFEGECAGKILTEPAGNQGFGYDPIFNPDAGDGRSFAQMSLTEKKSMSHRGAAIKKMQEFLSNDQK